MSICFGFGQVILFSSPIIDTFSLFVMWGVEIKFQGENITNI